ncbi:hypothetical protein LNTAR_16393 [Lentisphaera araneosa HTCC2155]|jgi:hypothetical protein|uniref:Uncharacterized protein n=1 Tax=Lentisphaera araneosa HTCC2155 TaxID=313628 RepID=A6DQ93_9BACT|nr:hypothetical protein [Lentisphaera araneosa]EDM26144.1 hypothetical protein LNTAR_16393 [Lentisphaera araneosa HTCC2155]
MGAEFNYYTYRGSKSELLEHHRELQVEECEQYGNDTYAGHIGIMPLGVEFVEIKPFASEAEARDYLEAEHCKWDRAMAIPFVGEGNIFDKASQKIMDQCCKAKRELVTLEADLLLKIRRTKSKTIGCKKCGSSISRLYITNTDCPVCGKRESFYSKTQMDRIKRKREKFKSLKSKPLRRTKVQVIHLVGGVPHDL